MDSFEWNKIAGAALFALLLSVGLIIFSGVIFSTERPESPGYIVAVFNERHRFEPGQTVHLKPRPEHAHLFDGASGARV
jgi:hypothetical protein